MERRLIVEPGVLDHNGEPTFSWVWVDGDLPPAGFGNLDDLSSDEMAERLAGHDYNQNVERPPE